MHFDQNKSIGALGTLIVAKWYRTYHPQHLLISLDSWEANKPRIDAVFATVEDDEA